MRKAADYRKHAQQCRDLAGLMEAPELRDQLLEMARHWEQTEQERIAFVDSHPEFAVEPESDNDDDPAPKRH